MHAPNLPTHLNIGSNIQTKKYKNNGQEKILKTRKVLIKKKKRQESPQKNLVQ
jgi:hypothetical protein